MQGYPTIKYWGYGGDKDYGNAHPYNGQRTSADLVSMANDLLDKANIDPEIHEIVNQKVFE